VGIPIANSAGIRRQALEKVRMSDCRGFRESVKKAEWSCGIDSHQTIIDTLKAGRVQQAEQELRTHIESHRERI